jgi:hypothetical protein
MPRPVERILVIKLSALGDFVLALAAMKRIRQVHAKAHITLLTTPPFEALAKICPYFNAVDIGGRPESFPEWMALRKRIKDANYARVYDLQTSAQSNRIFQLLRPSPPPWSGVAFGCSLPHKKPLGTACTLWSARLTSSCMPASGRTLRPSPAALRRPTCRG